MQQQRSGGDKGGINTKNQKVEWKDTRFSFSVDYNYSLFVRNRCAFFWATGNKWRKIINYASKFAKPNNICVVYLYGTPRGKLETFKEYIKKLNGNIIVIIFDISCSDIEAINRFDEWKKRKKACGIFDKSGNLNSKYFDERKQIMNAVTDKILSETSQMYQGYLEDDIIQQEYAVAKNKLEKVQLNSTSCVSNCVVFEEINPNENGMLEVIRSIFPYGVESDTTDVNCVKIAKANRYIKQARQGVNDEMGICFNSSEQLSFFVTKGASEILSFVQDMCNQKLQKSGTFTLSELWCEIERPPYGAYECNWYFYIFAFALNRFFSAPFSILFRYIAQSAESSDFVFSVRHRYGRIFYQSEKAEKLKNIVCRLFDLSDKRFIQDALTGARRWCEENAQTPLSWIDERLLELLTFDTDKWCYQNTADKFLNWISENEKELYSRLHNINDDYDKKLIAQGYSAERVRLWRKYSYIKGGAVGWLHSADDFNERCLQYMSKEHVCRECGRPIEKYYAYSRETFDNTKVGYTEFVFTEKQIIGLNKKFLGRYQNEYFCIPCLCEVLEATSEELHEKMKRFKEQGCELF